jgi:hypothetical protein
MKPPTKKQNLNNCYEAYHHMKHGTRPTRKARDGSIPTHPVVPVPELPEAKVLKQCLQWLKRHRIMADRHTPGNIGVGVGHVTFGIISAGDIMGILPDGVHFEIETKRGKGGRQSAGQQKRMADVRATNGVYLVCHGVAELEFLMGGLI